MELTTAVILEELQAWLSSAYPALYRECLLFVLAIAAACAVVPLFTVWALSRRDHARAEQGKPCKAYTHRDSSQITHAIASAALPLTALRKVWIALRSPNYGPWLTALAVGLLLLSLWAAYRLWRWRVSGIFAAGGYILCYAAFEQYRSFRYLAGAQEAQEGLPVMARYARYMAADYQATWAMASGLLALAALLFLAVYCYKRRFLFLPGRLDAPFCPSCGQVAGGDGGFCTNCGQPLPPELASVRPAVESLDQKIYCAKCGKGLVKSVCPGCGMAKDLVDGAKKAASEAGGEIKGKLRDVVVTVLLILLAAVLPNALSPLSHVMKGSGAVHNAFAQRLDALCGDPELASGDEWLAGFDSAADALYAVEARWCYVDPRSVPSGDLPALGAYAEASLLKMEVLEGIQKIVHGGMMEEAGGPSVLLGALQYTAGMQVDACQYRNTLFRQLGPLGKVEHGCLDGARIILWRVKTQWVAAAVLAVCALLCMWMLNACSAACVTELELRLQALRIRTDARRKKLAVGAPPAVATSLGRAFDAGKNVCFALLRVGNELWALAVQLLGAVVLLLSVFRWRNLMGLPRWVRAGLTDGPHARPVPSTAYQQVRRASNIAAAVAALLFLVYCAAAAWAAFGRGTAPAGMDKAAYLDMALVAANGYARPIADAVWNMQDGTAQEEDIQQLYGLLDAQAEADRAILDMDLSSMEDMEGMEEVHAGLRSLCTDDLAALERIMAALDEGREPPLELLDNYIRLRGENYLWVTQQLFVAYAVYGIEAVTS